MVPSTFGQLGRACRAVHTEPRSADARCPQSPAPMTSSDAPWARATDRRPSATSAATARSLGSRARQVVDDLVQEACCGREGCRARRRTPGGEVDHADDARWRQPSPSSTGCAKHVSIRQTSWPRVVRPRGLHGSTRSSMRYWSRVAPSVSVIPYAEGA